MAMAVRVLTTPSIVWSLSMIPARSSMRGNSAYAITSNVPVTAWAFFIPLILRRFSATFHAFPACVLTRT